MLGVENDRAAVAAAVGSWNATELESAVVAAGGVAGELRSAAEWARHPQGAAVAAEPLVARATTDAGPPGAGWRPTLERPLAGLRVLDLTRVLAGPVSTRLLAGLGAEVLRIDSPDWDEPAVVPDMTIGKRTARLDFRTVAGVDRLRELLAGADVFVNGYRSDALEQFGLGTAVRRATRPGLVDVVLDAFGYTGPWAMRRGFDSVVQLSAGLADTAMRETRSDRPVALPVQALDQATGYLMAASVLLGLARRARDGIGSEARLSLARTAVELERARDATALPAAPVPQLARTPIATPWGAAELLEPPVALGGVHLGWDRAPGELGAGPASWA